MTQLNSTGLCRLIYFSQVSPGLGTDGLENILTESIQRNTADHITGLLAHDQRYFMQVLEGRPDAVNELYQTILGDERHHCVRLISYGYISTRAFSRWAMALARIPALTQRALDSQFGGFNPPAFSADIAQEYLEIVSDHLAHFSTD